ncbi:hypothetical protein MKW92_018855, partial [Papaver armeniacum]
VHWKQKLLAEVIKLQHIGSEYKESKLALGTPEKCTTKFELRSFPVDHDIPWASDDGYLKWFNSVSHPIVQNPSRRLHQHTSERLNPSQPATGKF